MSSFQALRALLAILGVQVATGVAIFLLGRRQALLRRLLPLFVSGAAGVLLATACLDLLPESVRAGGNVTAMWATLLGTLLVLFCLRALADSAGSDELPKDESGIASANTSDHERHQHAHTHRSPGLTTTPLVLGSALHSAVDGVAIAAAFSAGAAPGWSAAIAVGLHELPHRLGDFTLLVHRGVPSRRAGELALGAGAMAFVGGLAVVVLGHQIEAARWLLPISAASFLYIALVDLVPELQAHRRGGYMWLEIACLLVGAATIAVITRFSGE